MKINYHEYEKKHLNKLRALSPECCVLLKKDGAFPLSSPCQIALYGSGARRTVKGGTGSGDVNLRHFVTIEEGLENAGFNITTKSWLNGYDSIKKNARAQFVENIKKRAAAAGIPPVIMGMGAVCPEPVYSLPLNGKGETAIYVLSRISGEGNDRKNEKGDFLLSDTEISDILALNVNYEKFMLVLNVGGIVDLSPVVNVKNILLLSQLGAITGDVLADILLGISYPSGKLTATWAEGNQYPAKNFGNLSDTLYTEGIYVGYRYFDTFRETPLFPFGYGLSYTDFDYKFIGIETIKSKIIVNVEIKNAGNFKGKQTLQLYVSSPNSLCDKPLKELVAFEKTKELNIGEKCEIAIAFDLSSLMCYNSHTAEYILETGNYILLLGDSSASAKPIAIVKVDRTKTVKKVRTLWDHICFEDLKPPKRLTFQTDGLPVVPIKTDDVDCVFIDYDLRQDIPDEVAALSDEQLALLCLGHFHPKTSSFVIGEAGVTVAGAAGETTHAIKNLAPLVMADGPAGLRLHSKYGKDEKGVYRIAPDIPDDVSDLMDEKFAAFIESKKDKGRNGKIYDQYCTMLPVGVAIAQSFSKTVCYECGNIVGNEMERFGIGLWLAPALNIQRSPLCGRNYEYYSEDPLVSGKIASWITLGVQSHKGCGVTIKHFACNNQETNRYASNSVLSERAFREIYLKGFEIAIKESMPRAVMTSFNLINGIHTSEDEKLLIDVLRCELGFNGLIVSDWVTPGNEGTKYPPAYADTSIKAGNDLFMPGGEIDYEKIISALRSGTLNREHLLRCAAHVYQTIKGAKR